jgi:hypothetical protein
MKQILCTALMLFSITAFSQADCSARLKTKTFPDGEVMTSAKESINVAKGTTDGIFIDMVFTKNILINIGTLSKEIKCIGPKARLYVFFTDGSRLNLEHMAKLNCKGDLKLFFGEVFQNNKELETLKTKKIQMLGIEYSNTVNGEIKFKTENFEFTDAQATAFMNNLTCLSNL